MRLSNTWIVVSPTPEIRIHHSHMIAKGICIKRVGVQQLQPSRSSQKSSPYTCSLGTLSRASLISLVAQNCRKFKAECLPASTKSNVQGLGYKAAIYQTTWSFRVLEYRPFGESIEILIFWGQYSGPHLNETPLMESSRRSLLVCGTVGS